MIDSTATTSAREYVVEGMTCGHCVTSVREEVSEIPGVERIELSLSDGRLKVSGSNLSDEAVRAAVELAGYTVAKS